MDRLIILTLLLSTFIITIADDVEVELPRVPVFQIDLTKTWNKVLKLVNETVTDWLEMQKKDKSEEEKKEKENNAKAMASGKLLVLIHKF